jgi:hypothetical protein
MYLGHLHHNMTADMYNWSILMIQVMMLNHYHKMFEIVRLDNSIQLYIIHMYLVHLLHNMMIHIRNQSLHHFQVLIHYLFYQYHHRYNIS